MTTIPESSELTSTIDEQFLAIVSSDVELLRAEFNAIIAAEWPEPPRHGPKHGHTVNRPLGRTLRSQERRQTRPRRCPSHVGIDGWRRQRSPPPNRHHNQLRK
jgi:hypothetical protein